MANPTERYLKTGGDPRTLPDYAALRDELNKLTHPARPDVNWQYVERLCLSLFEHNGVDLQTAAWYALSRTQLAGVYGLNEGLALLEALLSRQWGNLWPQPVYARMDILNNLSKRLQQTLRTVTLTYTDLNPLYRAEQHLTRLGDILQRLALKHLSQTDTLRLLVHNAAVKLENSDGAVGDRNGPSHPATVNDSPPGTMPANDDERSEHTRWSYVPQPETPVTVVTEPSRQPPSWQMFAAGAASALIAGCAALWGWQYVSQPDPLLGRLTASLAPLPGPLETAQLASLRRGLPSAQVIVDDTQQQLARLARLPPGWNLSYGNGLVKQAAALVPEQATRLRQRWQLQLDAAALPLENLNGWHQGMAQLQQLSSRLNALDERRGRYLTGSELKTMVYDITRAFSRTVPVEEQLRQMVEMPAGPHLPVAQQTATEQHLQQLIVRYTVLMQNRTTQTIDEPASHQQE